MGSFARVGLIVLFALLAVSGIAQGAGYHEGPDDCLPEVRFDDPALQEDEFTITADIEIVDSPDVFRVTYTVSVGESVENYTLEKRQQGGLFEVAETNMTSLSDGDRYKGEGTSSITTVVNTSESTLEWFWESENYTAFSTEALSSFALTIGTKEATYENENAFIYTEFNPPDGYQGTEMYDAEMVTFGDPQHVFTYDTPDGTVTLVSDRPESEFTHGLNYSRVRKHLTEDLNLTTDNRHRALYLFPLENTSARAGGCNGRAYGKQDAIVHEYVHLRQHDSLFDPDRLWMIEGGARYFGSQITYHEGIGGKRALPVYFMERAHYPEMNLTDPDTWPNLAEYTKGGRAHNWMAYLGVDVQALYRASYHKGFDNDALVEFLRTNARKDPSRLITELNNASLMPRYIYGDRFLNDQEDLLVRNDTRHSQFTPHGFRGVYYNIEDPIDKLPTADLEARANDTTIEYELNAVGSGVDVYVSTGVPVKQFGALQTPKPLYYDATLDGEPVEYYFGKPDSADPAFRRFRSFLTVPNVNLSEPATLRFEYNESAALAVTNPDYDPGIPAYPTYEPVNVSTPDSVVAGESITGSVTIKNTGDAAGSQDIAITINGEPHIVHESVALNASESVTKNFTYTLTDDHQSVEGRIETDDDGAGFDVSVIEPPPIEASVVDFSSNASVGDTVEIGYRLENAGDVAVTRTVTLTVNDEVMDVIKRVKIEPNDSVTGAFTYEVPAVGGTELRVKVSSDGDTDGTTIEVLDPPSFAVELTDVPSVVEADKQIEVDYTVHNTGEEPGVVNLSLERDGEVVATEDRLTVSKNGSTSGTFLIEVGPDGPRTVTLTLKGDTTESSRNLSVSPAEQTETGLDGTGTTPETGMATETGTDRPDSQDLPGFGLSGALLGLAGLLWLVRRRR